MTQQQWLIRFGTVIAFIGAIALMFCWAAKPHRIDQDGPVCGFLILSGLFAIAYSFIPPLNRSRDKPSQPPPA